MDFSQLLFISSTVGFILLYNGIYFCKKNMYKIIKENDVNGLINSFDNDCDSHKYLQYAINNDSHKCALKIMELDLNISIIDVLLYVEKINNYEFINNIDWKSKIKLKDLYKILKTSNKKFIKYMINNGLNINMVDCVNNNVLHYLFDQNIFFNKLNIIDICLYFGINLFKKNDIGLRPLDKVIDYDHANSIIHLYEKHVCNKIQQNCNLPQNMKNIIIEYSTGITINNKIRFI